MAFVKEEMEITLKEISEYSLVIKYLIDKGIISIDKFKDILLKSNMEERALMFGKVLSKIKDEYYEDAISLASASFSKYDCINRAYTSVTELEESMNILVNASNIDSLITNETYINVLRELALKDLLQKASDDIDSKSSLTNAKPHLEKAIINSYTILVDDITRENDLDIKRNINGFYLRKVR
ncbi:MAG: hypothetical protein RR359_04370 [Bacilli bacterium]